MKDLTAAERKQHPVGSGVLDYFPDALMAVANCSWRGNEQHNPGEPLHWAREKSTDEADALIRHFLERGTVDGDGVRHSAKMAWRALALLQKEIEAAEKPLEWIDVNTGERGVVNHPRVCCREFSTCSRACTPRGEWIAEQRHR